MERWVPWIIGGVAVALVAGVAVALASRDSGGGSGGGEPERYTGGQTGPATDAGAEAVRGLSNTAANAVGPLIRFFESSAERSSRERREAADRTERREERREDREDHDRDRQNVVTDAAEKRRLMSLDAGRN